jgi:hypothetical protein
METPIEGTMGETAEAKGAKLRGKYWNFSLMASCDEKKQRKSEHKTLLKV